MNNTSLSGRLCGFVGRNVLFCLFVQPAQDLGKTGIVPERIVAALLHLLPAVPGVVVDGEVIKIGAFALRAQCAILFTHGLVTCTILYLQAVGRAFLGTVLAAARQGFFFLPLVFLLPMRFGLLGLCLAQPAADALTFFFAWTIRKTRIRSNQLYSR